MQPNDETTERIINAAAKYRRGRDAEGRLVIMAQEAGCIAWRCAGSKGQGATDVVVVSMATGAIALNSKRGSWAPPAERVAMRHLMQYGILPILVRFDVVTTRTGLTMRPLFHTCDMDEPTTGPPWSAEWLAL